MQAVSPVDPVAGVLSSLPALPAVGGLEGVGVVEAAGPGSSLKAGDWVIPAPGAGCWTTHAVFDDAQLTPVPNNIPCEYAAVRKSSRVRSRMLTYAHVCSRMLTSAENHARKCLLRACLGATLSLSVSSDCLDTLQVLGLAPATAYRLMNDFVSLKAGDTVHGKKKSVLASLV